jgi:hypothetical protein
MAAVSDDGLTILRSDYRDTNLRLSKNGGKTWINRILSEYAWFVDAKIDSQGKNMIALYEDSLVYISRDGGFSFKKCTLNNHLDIRQLGGLRSVSVSPDFEHLCVMTGGYGQYAAPTDFVYTSHDFGATWTNFSLPDSELRPWAQCDFNGTVVYALAQDGSILRFIHGVDRNWKILPQYKGGNYSSFYMTDSGKHLALVASVDGSIQISHDFGRTFTRSAWKPKQWTNSWGQFSRDIGPHIHISENGQLLATGMDGTHLSTDGGLTWEKQWLGGYSDRVSASLNGHHVFIISDIPGQLNDNQLLMLSLTPTNASKIGTYRMESWMFPFDMEYPDSYRALAASDDLKYRFVATEKMLASSADGGETYLVTKNSTFEDVAVNGVRCSSDGSVVVVTPQAAKMRLSTDFGTSWISIGEAMLWADIALSRNGRTIVASGSGSSFTSFVQYSFDRGATWSSFPETQAEHIAVSSDGKTILLAEASTSTFLLYRNGVWGVVPSPFNVEPRSVSSMFFCGSTVYVVGYEKSLYASSDYTSWQLVSKLPTDRAVCSSDGSHWMAYGELPSLYIASDAVTWSENPDFPQVHWEFVYQLAVMAGNGSRAILVGGVEDWEAILRT